MSFDVSTYRVGDESNPDGSQDPKLNALNADLLSTLSAADDASVVQDVKVKLIELVGAANVTSTQGPPLYIFMWDPRTEAWIRVCIMPTTLLVSDGEPKPVKVEVAVRTVPA